MQTAMLAKSLSGDLAGNGPVLRRPPRRARLVCPPATLISECRIVTWNARELFPVEKKRQAVKSAAFEALAVTADIILIQETHGGTRDLAVRHPQIFSLFESGASVCNSAATGGVLTLVRKSWCPAGTTVCSAATADGRIIRTEIYNNTHSMKVWNVHNQDIRPDELKRTLLRMKADLALVARTPLTSALVIAGDWNFAAEGDRSFSIVNGETSFTSADTPHKRQHATAWNDVLTCCTDIHAT